MSDIAIKVEDVSKLYRLGKIGTGSFKNDLRRLWYQIKGKEDPFSKIGVENDRTKKAESEWVWALKDINFNVKKGEVLGIIGRNGAGKSTLLKILSKITAPTTGQITINGRIASLLEVGTGFHPELSGRENIFLNGAILGMRKWEIHKKFDEIVDFAGVEAYIDTPVKRYSSGMYVRLAFAVAAFLEPEILIIDEVLSVGDAEFQKKCLGRMQDVSKNEGRTVLFVSHNMGTVVQLCQNSILLNKGYVEACGESINIIDRYYSDSKEKLLYFDDSNKEIYIKEIFTCKYNSELSTSFAHSEDIHLRMKIVVNKFNNTQNIGIALLTNNKTRVFTVNKNLSEFYDLNSKEILVDFIIEKNLIAPMDYSFLVALNTRTGLITYDWHEDICNIKVYDTGTDLADVILEVKN